MLAKALQAEKYNLFCNYNQNREDMETFKKDLNLSPDVTGLIGTIEDGEIIELWATENNIPWDLTTNYERIK